MWSCNRVAAHFALLLALSGSAASRLSAADAPSPTPPVAKADASAAAAAKPQSPDEIALRKTLKTLTTALREGDRDGIRKIIYAKTPTERKMVDAMSGMAAQLAGLHKASVKAFGEEEAAAMTGDLAGEVSKIDEAEVVITGESATVRYAQPAPPAPATTRPSKPPADGKTRRGADEVNADDVDDSGDIADAADANAGEPMVLKKVDGRWQVPVSELSKETTPEEIEQQLADLEIQSKVIGEVTADIAAGKFKTADQAADAWQSKMMAAITPKRAETQKSPTTAQSAKNESGKPGKSDGAKGKP